MFHPLRRATTKFRSLLTPALSAASARKQKRPGFPGPICRADREPVALRLFLLFLGPEIERAAVHAIAQPGRLGAVVEDVAEMPAAFLAMHLGAGHKEAAVDRGLDRPVHRLIKTRPAAAAVELAVALEQRGAAAGAVIGAGIVFLVERAGAGPLGAVLAQHLKLLRRQLPAPLVLAHRDIELLVLRHPSPFRVVAPNIGPGAAEVKRLDVRTRFEQRFWDCNRPLRPSLANDKAEPKRPFSTATIRAEYRSCAASVIDCSARRLPFEVLRLAAFNNG